MPYQANKPEATDQLSVSQNDIQQNFQEIANLIMVNHETFGATYAGMHKWVAMPRQAGDPALVATEATLFSKLGSSGQTELFYRNTANTFSMTDHLHAQDGWSRLASGLLIKWGRDTTAAVANPKTVTMAAGELFTTIYSVIISPTNNFSGTDPSSVMYYNTGSANAAANTFQYVSFNRTSGSNIQGRIHYLVIGV